MVNREQLNAGARRAYEMGRLRFAARAAVYLLPVSAVCALESRNPEQCACIGVALIAATVLFRWRSRQGVESALIGVVAGSFPLLIGLGLSRAIHLCGDAAGMVSCSTLCVPMGVASGLWIGFRSARVGVGRLGTVAALGIAALTASLGCIGLGIGGVMGVGVGLSVGVVAASLVSARA